MKNANVTQRFTVAMFIITVLLALHHQTLLAQSAALRPNILIVFTDDQGYGDLGCYGSKTNKTPRMDRLAREGMMFTNFYAQHVCGPSRSALLTGRYPIRSKGWGMPADEITFAELISKVGYQTACIGKWDVSNRKAILERMPLAQGFDYYFGTLGANDGGRVVFHENNERVGETRDMGSLIRLYTDKAIGYLKDKRDPGKPFVLYVAHTMMHTIIDASPEFKGTSKGGLYGDVVEEFDFHTGRLLDTVDALGLRENTLVIYTTDNGPWNQPAYTNNKKGHPVGSVFWGAAGPLRDGKGSCYEAGSRAPCIVRWPGRVPGNTLSDAIFATVDFMPTFASLTGYTVPAERVIDGVDQTILLFGQNAKGSRDTFFYQGNGVRKGKWKYLRAQHQVPNYARDLKRKEVEELYDLDTDIGETTNLAKQYPEKVKELRQLLEAIKAGR
jgi:arylsulfatase A-like enzyme